MKIKLYAAIIAGLLLCALLSTMATRKSAAPPSTTHEQPTLLAQTLLPPAAPDRTVPLEQYTPIESVVDLALLHAVLTDTPLTDADFEKYAGMQSYEYRAAPDAFSRQRILEPLKNKMQEKLRAFKGNRYIRITQPAYLDHYDLKTHTFPLTTGPGSPVDWLQGGRLAYTAQTESYVLRLSNAPDFSNYIVRDEPTARALEARIVPQRTGQATVYLFIQDAALPAPVAYITDHPLRAQIVKVQLYDPQHQLIGELPPF